MFLCKHFAMSHPQGNKTLAGGEKSIQIRSLHAALTKKVFNVVFFVCN